MKGSTNNTSRDDVGVGLALLAGGLPTGRATCDVTGLAGGGGRLCGGSPWTGTAGAAGDAARAGRLEVDHQTPVKDGGQEYDLSNLQTLCFTCHFAKTAAEMGYQPPGPERLAWARYLADMI